MSLTVRDNKTRLLKKMGLNKPKPKDDDVKEDPCWDTHKQVGMKRKGNKMVPNCVPKNEAKVDELSMSTKDIKKSGLRKTTDTDKLKKELEQLKKLLKQKRISVETFMSRRPGNQMSDLYKLYTLAIRAMPGSQKQKELKKRIAALRKELKLDEKLGKDADAGDYIDDFKKSDAPQFKGKSDKKKKDMAIAAYLDAKDKKEEVELGEKVEYVEYKFKNRNDAMKAKAYFDGIQLMNFDVNDDGASQGKLTVDAKSKDMTKYHKEVMKKFRPRVMTQEDVPSNNTGSIPNPADTVMGPKKKKSHTSTIHDKRYKKSLMGQTQPVLLKRFRDYYDAKGIGG